MNEIYYFYILRSEKDNKLYKGITNNLENRVKRHNLGYVRSTRNRRPFKLIYSEEFPDKRTALKREKYCKSYSGGLDLAKILKKLS